MNKLIEELMSEGLSFGAMTAICMFLYQIPVYLLEVRPEGAAFASKEKIKLIFKNVESILPVGYRFVLPQIVDVVYIGECQPLISRELDALFHEGAIYLSSTENDPKQVVENIIHEISHAIEEVAKDLIYGDQELEREFMEKRAGILSRYEMSPEIESALESPEYDEDLDMFLYDDIGYSELGRVTHGAAPSPYALTSLREYWGMGFEKFYLNPSDKSWHASCPVLISKIREVDSHFDQESWK